MDDIAGRIVLIVDASVPAAARAACDDAAAALAQRAGMPVTLAAVPIETLDAVQPVLRRGPGQIRDLDPRRLDHRGRDGVGPVRAGAATAGRTGARCGRRSAIWRSTAARRSAARSRRCAAPPAEIAPPRRRPRSRPSSGAGSRRRTGLATEPAGPGWIAITCASARMAAWLCATIILENVDARAEGARLLVPAGPGFALEDQVKSVITVVAKTHHYWREHLESARETRS